MTAERVELTRASELYNYNNYPYRIDTIKWKFYQEIRIATFVLFYMLCVHAVGKSVLKNNNK